MNWRVAPTARLPTGQTTGVASVLSMAGLCRSGVAPAGTGVGDGHAGCDRRPVVGDDQAVGEQFARRHRSGLADLAMARSAVASATVTGATLVAVVGSVLVARR